MYPYYILKTNNFDSFLNGYSIPTQATLDNIIEKDPTISFIKCEHQPILNHIKYDLISESKKKQKGRAYANDTIFEYFISIDEKYTYYNKNNGIFILESSKLVFSNFCSHFIKKGSSKNNFEKLEIDFLKIIDNQHSSGVKGVWLGDYGDNNIDSLYLMGNQIEDSSQYKNLINKGAKISNVTIAYNYKNELLKIMLTKDGGVILYSKVDSDYALNLIEDVYSKLLT